MKTYYTAHRKELLQVASLPVDVLPFTEAIERVLPPQISTLHQGLAHWATHDLSPGSVSPERLWLDPENQLYFAFAKGRQPRPIMQTGLAAEIAAWLVLLDRWMETYVIIARARSVWSPDELAGALSFLTPAFLPPVTVRLNPDWAQVAEAVALAVADGPLVGKPTDKHWQGDQETER